MEKINKTHLSVALLLIVVLLFPLIMQYDNFIFHTYETKVYQKLVYYGLNDTANLDYYTLIENEEGYQFGNAKLTILNEDFIKENDELEVVSIIDEHEFKHVLEKEDLYHYNLDFITNKKLNSAKNLTVRVNNKTNGKSIELPMNEGKLNVYTGQNKDFTVKELYVYKNRVQFGSINCANIDKWKNQYDTVRIEYRYKKPNAEVNDPYLVFYKTEGTLDDMLNHYSLDLTDVKMDAGTLLQDLDLSVVIILQGQEDLAFSINLNKVIEVTP